MVQKHFIHFYAKTIFQAHAMQLLILLKFVEFEITFSVDVLIALVREFELKNEVG